MHVVLLTTIVLVMVVKSDTFDKLFLGKEQEREKRKSHRPLVGSGPL